MGLMYDVKGRKNAVNDDIGELQGLVLADDVVVIIGTRMDGVFRNFRRKWFTYDPFSTLAVNELGVAGKGDDLAGLGAHTLQCFESMDSIDRFNGVIGRDICESPECQIHIPEKMDSNVRLAGYMRGLVLSSSYLIFPAPHRFGVVRSMASAGSSACMRASPETISQTAEIGISICKRALGRKEVRRKGRQCLDPRIMPCDSDASHNCTTRVKSHLANERRTGMQGEDTM
ncbi:hypothetical protein F5141DRAFT_1064357 [Pisolithus sp. B1]|nr:hypothetical protein F5141DRAFT_1064357 [Pisolithus sp. B1]